MTRQIEALIAGAYLSRTNTRRVKRTLATLFCGAVGKDAVSRTYTDMIYALQWRRTQMAAKIIGLSVPPPGVTAGRCSALQA